MALSDIELARVKRTVGDFCTRRNRPELHHELRLEYKIEGQAVVLFEVRERYGKLVGVTDIPVAKLKYVRTAEEWRLYWQRSDLKWHRYDFLPASRHIEPLVKEIEEDPFCCFFG